VSHFSNDCPEEEGWPDERWVTTEPTEEDWREFCRWRDSLPAGPEPEAEPCGQAFPDQEPPW
jgi:hypothetical protein